MTSVQRILEQKGREVFSIGPEATVLEALGKLQEHDIGALLVLEEGRPIGIFSERDYARKVFLKGKSSPDTRIRDVMSTPLVHVEPRHDVDYCMGIMTRLRHRHLPVLENGELVGIVSIGDVVKSIIDEKDFVIDQLETYIVSGR